MMTKRYISTLALLLVLVASPAAAATISFGGSRSFTVGDTFAIPVFVSTASGESMNAISASVKFPPNKLRIVSVSDSGIIDLWAEKPAYSNAEGSVTFQGVSYNPGFAGTNGRVVTINFRALEAGEAALSFTDASVLANDGEGTEILSSSRGATVSIARGGTTAPAQKPTTPPTEEKTEKTEKISDTPVEASTTPPLFDISSEHAPTTSEASHVLTFKIPYGFLLSVREYLIGVAPLIVTFVGIGGWVFLAFWLGWHRMHRLRRTLLSRIAATDADLHGELLELHDAIADEVKRLKSKDAHGSLTAEEKHILTRFSTLLENMEQVKTWHLKLPRRRH